MWIMLMHLHVNLNADDDDSTQLYCFVSSSSSIGVAPIMQYSHVGNKNSNTQGSSPNVVKVVFYTLRNCS